MTQLRGKTTPASNPGSFRSTGNSSPDAALPAQDGTGPTPAYDAYLAAQNELAEAERKLLKAGEDAIREAILADHPNASKAEFMFEESLSPAALFDTDGHEIDFDSSDDSMDLQNILYDIGGSFDSYEYLRRHSGFAHDTNNYDLFTLDLRAPEGT